ncbi:unnamed protein product [Meloidogyne enterolobii]|uniref:Uncharacterized protein n=1 Tax=Meloidogyne enterolobii TaxID=390850 RepID=A0ACB0ZB39_MELEN
MKYKNTMQCCPHSVDKGLCSSILFFICFGNFDKKLFMVEGKFGINSESSI